MPEANSAPIISNPPSPPPRIATAPAPKPKLLDHIDVKTTMIYTRLFILYLGPDQR